ncbi:YtxH domain-containing protein [Panacibacter ginsenosidivorans]|uniref:YtxH domain-containing protein n=2 Tax=Panacibacter ginsenosidivorans TaxID=1813871 RepID=A0A5B8VF96_9BACT|nr:YtxH domain-containing protein [Panacibacter ginsenosidivorans]
MNSTTKIVAAAVIGAAAGLAAGILFAPYKGKETRKKINEQGKKLAKNAKDTFRKGKEKFEDIKDEAEQFLKDKIDEFA